MPERRAKLTAPGPVTASFDPADQAALLSVLLQVKNGNFSARMPLDWTGVPGKIADALNEVIAANETLEVALSKVSRVVGKEGKLSRRVVLGGSDGGWSVSIESVNSLIDDLVRPTIEMQRVIGAVTSGDLSKKITAEVQGEMLERKNTLNAQRDGRPAQWLRVGGDPGGPRGWD
jgi:hypothetical protein